MSGSRRDEARLLREFISESEEILEQAAGRLAQLFEAGEETPPDVVNGLFRAVHSMKGLAGMVGLPALSETAHDLESLLDGVRMGKVPVDAVTLEAVRGGLAGLGELTRRVGAGERDPGSPETLLQAMAAAGQPRPRAEAAAQGARLELPPELERVLTEYERHRVTENQRKGRQVLIVTLEFTLETFDEGLRRGMSEAGAIGELIGTFPGQPSTPEVMCFVLLVGAPPAVAPDEVARRCGAVSVQRVEGSAAPPRLAAPEPATVPVAVPSAFATVRVSLEKVSALLDLTGQLAMQVNVLRGPLERALRATTDRAARQEVQRVFAQLDRTADGLGRAAQATRLVPIDQLTTRLERAVATIAKSLGREAVLEVTGGDTELDKVLSDALADPLLHMLRNAVDHGIEPPDERLSAGKPRAGRITLTAEARGRDVAITLADDGRGMRPEELVARAREKGLLPAGEPDPEDPLTLVFRPGFSTAAAVSEVSGRGVGLDVVRANIADLKGSVSVRSEPGAGTAFEIVVPITLAVVESLLVRASDRFFAFPTSSIVRTLAVSAERLDRGDGWTLRDDDGESLQLVPLARLLGLGSVDPAAGASVVVAEQGSRRAGLVVDRIEGLSDLIIKSLPEELLRLPEVTGAAELPDGQVALTLDAGLLLERAERVEAAG